METCNKIQLLLIVCLSFNLLSVRAACAPRSFRYLEPKLASISSLPTPTSSPPPSVPKATPPSVSNPVVPPSPPKPATPAPTPAAPVKQQAAPAPATPPPAPKQQATPVPATPPPAPTQQATPAPTTPPPTQTQQANPAPATPPPAQTQQAKAPVNPEVKKVCDATDNPMLCMATVSPLLQGKFDVVSILQTEVNACKTLSQTLLDKSVKLSADPSTIPDVAKTLKTCKENYESVIDNMEKTIQAIAEKDLGTVNTMLSAAIADVSTCGENFSEVATNPNPLVDMEQSVTNLVGNCLSISASLKW
ncbi:hypothetical protein AQUCO_00300532v1 [Aquilegia coerulea]|uniref:Pectinesterase inhibitor domain-containing protein n=1 Tax=Aquilegia coerulea TaxID=218851 RepID=A0A2G5EZ81_AQUCA|nr:hypothetical protein AQUCO_00300532v1 [Aquilegia coerulea]